QLSRATGQRRGFFLMPEDVFRDLAAGDRGILALRARPGGATAGASAPNGVAVSSDLGIDSDLGPARHTEHEAGGGDARATAPSPGGGRLGPREVEVSAALRHSAGPAGVAAALGVSVNTAKTHVRSVYRKLGASGREEALRLADSIGRDGR